ncbi:radical S-adenosyl methionine domain-containing protein 1, mitochondrial-like [Penaeus chinensis]|uniref:radical S-adenosyl methionine domain-containing protein 1, mitochondrial-like n=1 Tax=Penaeus chinensis TaxID=139456 RepID=UPI001FB7C1FC|nr:radical S-adenosyl methionine domain-containing protein 1, mitochondrial-like [Penaeus chinensis]
MLSARNWKILFTYHWNLKVYGKSIHQRFCHNSLAESYISEGSVYVHWPYCRQRCTYCNFVKFIPHQKSQWTLQNEVLEDAMVKELQNALRSSYISTVKSVFFGGGTPSLARPHLIEKIMNAVQGTCSVTKNAEITLEVNPTPQESVKLKDFMSAGINRVSLGIQALDDSSLKFFNRDHSVEEALKSIEYAKKIFPGRVSLDLIFGRPRQTHKRWMDELHKVLNVCDDHLSLYQLTVERGTKLHRQVAAGEVALPEDDVMAMLYEASVSFLHNAGFKRYEVSNFARGSEAECLHNKLYWKNSQYIGVGPGAHSRVVLKNDTLLKSESLKHHHTRDDKTIDLGIKENTAYKNLLTRIFCRAAIVNAADPVSWLQEVHLYGTGARNIKFQTRLDILHEYVASGLRTSEGVTAAIWQSFCPWRTLVDIFQEDTLWLQEKNLLEISDAYMRATELGLNVLDYILPYLINVVERELNR